MAAPQPALSETEEKPRDELEAIGRMLAALADLVGSAKDLHIVDPDGLSLLLSLFGRMTRRQADRL